MNKRVSLAALIVIFVVALGGLAIVNHHRAENKKAHTQTAAQKEHAALVKAPVKRTLPNNATTAVATNSVDLINFSFNPANITVTAGTTVTWTNQDGVAHDIAESDGQAGPSSPKLNQHDTYTYTFNTPGTYKYHSAVSPSMVGTVTVTAQ